MARKYSTQLGKSNSSALCNLLRKNSLSGNIRVVSTFFQSRNFENVPNTIPSWIQRMKLKIYAGWCWSLWILFYNYTLKYLENTDVVKTNHENRISLSLFAHSYVIRISNKNTYIPKLRNMQSSLKKCRRSNHILWNTFMWDFLGM